MVRQPDRFDALLSVTPNNHTTIGVGAQSTLGGIKFLPEKYVLKISKMPDSYAYAHCTQHNNNSNNCTKLVRYQGGSLSPPNDCINSIKCNLLKRTFSVLPRSGDDHAGDLSHPFPFSPFPLSGFLSPPTFPFLLPFSFPSLPFPAALLPPRLLLEVGPLKSR